MRPKNVGEVDQPQPKPLCSPYLRALSPTCEPQSTAVAAPNSSRLRTLETPRKGGKPHSLTVADLTAPKRRALGSEKTPQSPAVTASGECVEESSCDKKVYDTFMTVAPKRKTTSKGSEMSRHTILRQPTSVARKGLGLNRYLYATSEAKPKSSLVFTDIESGTDSDAELFYSHQNPRPFHDDRIQHRHSTKATKSIESSGRPVRHVVTGTGSGGSVHREVHRDRYFAREKTRQKTASESVQSSSLPAGEKIRRNAASVSIESLIRSSIPAGDVTITVSSDPVDATALNCAHLPMHQEEQKAVTKTTNSVFPRDRSARVQRRRGYNVKRTVVINSGFYSESEPSTAAASKKMAMKEKVSSASPMNEKTSELIQQSKIRLAASRQTRKARESGEFEKKTTVEERAKESKKLENCKVFGATGRLIKYVGRIPYVREKWKNIRTDKPRLTEKTADELEGHLALGFSETRIRKEQAVDENIYKQALASGSVPINRYRVMVVGQDGAGKSCLIDSFLDRKFKPQNQSTDGIAIHVAVTAAEGKAGQDTWHEEEHKKHLDKYLALGYSLKRLQHNVSCCILLIF